MESKGLGFGTGLSGETNKFSYAQTLAYYKVSLITLGVSRHSQRETPSFSTRTFWLCGNGTKYCASCCQVAQQLIMDTLCPCCSPLHKWLKLSVQTLAQRPEFLHVSHNTKQIPRVRQSSNSTRKMLRTF